MVLSVTESPDFSKILVVDYIWEVSLALIQVTEEVNDQVLANLTGLWHGSRQISQIASSSCEK